MYSIGFGLLIYISFIVLVEGQCFNESTCECHCKDCFSDCKSCLPGWSGSITNLCQKGNTLFNFSGVISKDSKLLDGDKTSSEENSDSDPSMLVQLRNSTSITQLTVHLELETEETYQIFVKDSKTSRDPSFLCDTYTHNEGRDTKTIIFKCKQPLVGTYIEIVPLKAKSIKVFEIEHFECSDGTYGENCSNICSDACGNQCDKDTGDCVCKAGFYGKLCNNVCSNLCKNSKCHSQSGDCIDCNPGRYGPSCQNNCSQGCRDPCNMTSGSCTCKQGYFLANCSQVCSKHCTNSGCVKENGTCLTCITGNYGPKCDLTCLGDCDGGCNKFTGECGTCTKTKYGPLCNKTCPVTCEDELCERQTGECNMCVRGFWGDRCSENCSINCEGGICDKHSGECEQCKKGLWGDRCSENCSINCEGGICDKHSGECEQCKRGFWGDRCSENCSINCEGGICYKKFGDCKQCKGGFWGVNCSDVCPRNCENCVNKFKCHNCSNGWYGVSCENPCPDHCGDSRSCDKVTGNCHICSLGYFGNTCNRKCSKYCDPTEMCDQENGRCKKCKAGRGGGNCTEMCNVQCKNFTCHKNESCVHGCKDGWFGPKCTEKCSLAVRNCAKCNDTTEPEPVCQRCFESWYLRDSECHKCPQNCISCKSDEKCFQCEKNMFHGETCKSTCDRACINNTCDLTGNCIYGCEKKKYGRECDQDCPIECKTCQNSSHCLTCEDGYEGALCSAGVDGRKKKADDCDAFDDTCTNDADSSFTSYLVVLAIVPLICLVPFLIIGLLKQKWKNRGLKSETEIIVLLDSKKRGPHYENIDISAYVTRGSVAFLEEIDQSNNDVLNDDIIKIENHVYVNVKVSRISTSSLWEYMLKNTANGNFLKEFQELPDGLLLRATEAKKAENKKRNRYKHIYPYDTNRVVLAAENEESCYINASFVDGFENPKEYIAAQGPFTSETVVDFWRMVWQQSVNAIVVLTNLEENGIMKCKKYWPSTQKTYGGIEVKNISSVSSNYHTVHSFHLLKESESRDLELFHFTAWPDKGVPSDVNSILDFRRIVKTKTGITNPIVVHCSAGIGRTGTYIALDYLINQGQRDKSVDVISCVTKLRNQRAHLVQTVEQYIYLYGALTKELTGKQSMVREGEFLTSYNQLKIPNPDIRKSELEEEFSLIEKLLPEVNEIQCQAAKDINNRPKNRYSNILAGDNDRVYLNGEGSDYINAIFLPSAQHRFGYIITNTPMDNTVEDFLSMVEEQEVYTIVQLTDNDEIDGWPGNYRFTPTSEKQRFDSFDLQSYQFHNNQVVHLYNGHLWNGKRFVPSGYRALASLVDAVLEERRNHSGSPVLVVCQNGAERSGLFCVLANLVEQLHLFRSVDVLQTVLNVRHRRSQVVPCMEQLEYIYDFIDNYLKMQNGEHVDEIVYFNEPNGLV
uniref:protein-tyrosine-phosphatase n=1 Tax=Crassostrea virginica TaxID=6565 RepID=A0A8B8CJ49_CRAVI|nr:uncharacterized protein LOC111119719 [Crassostrea virginica]